MKFFLNLDFKKILTERERAVLKSILKGEDNDSEEDLCALYSNWKLFIILNIILSLSLAPLRDLRWSNWILHANDLTINYL